MSAKSHASCKVFQFGYAESLASFVNLSLYIFLLKFFFFFLLGFCELPAVLPLQALHLKYLLQKAASLREYKEKAFFYYCVLIKEMLNTYLEFLYGKKNTLVPHNMEDGEFRQVKIKLTILRANVSGRIKIIHLLPAQ